MDESAQEQTPPACPHTALHIEVTSIVCDNCRAVVGRTLQTTLDDRRIAYDTGHKQGLADAGIGAEGNDLVASSPLANKDTANPPKFTPTNTSLRDELEQIAFETNGRDFFPETLDRLESLLTAKTQYNDKVADNIRMVANNDLPMTWLDPMTNNRLYNEAAVTAKTTEARIEELSHFVGVLDAHDPYKPLEDGTPRAYVNRKFMERLAQLQQLDKGEA